MQTKQDKQKIIITNDLAVNTGQRMLPIDLLVFENLHSSYTGNIIKFLNSIIFLVTLKYNRK